MRTTQKITRHEAPQAAAGGQVAHQATRALLTRLPRWLLWPLLVTLLGLLMADVSLADPLPLVDEAALLWALSETWKALMQPPPPARPVAASAPPEGTMARQSGSGVPSTTAYSRL